MGITYLLHERRVDPWNGAGWIGDPTITKLLQERVRDAGPIRH